MQIHELIQGTPAWHAYRSEHDNASDAPAMMGLSPYKSRNELLHERFVGMAKDVSATTQALFDNGHRFEALARPLAEEIVGEDLYPVTGSLGNLSASFDGLTMDELTVWEHKTLNDEIRAAKDVSDLGKHLHVQMEQQLLISGAERCLFLASKWTDDGELIGSKHFWYVSDKVLRASIISGWAQFRIDLANFKPVAAVVKPEAEAIIALPALAIQIRGEVTLSNLPQFKAAAERFIAQINTDLVTDVDFANAEATVKFCEKAEKDLELTKASAIAQTASIDELMRTIDYIQSELRSKRLTLDKLVKSQKEVIKAGILSASRLAFADHVRALQAEIAPITLPHVQPDFAGAMKNKRTLASLHDAVDSALAAGKIEIDAQAQAVRGRLAWYRSTAAGSEFLFHDLQQIIQKADDDFQMLVNSRITDNKAKEDARLVQIQEDARIAAEAKVAADAEKARVLAEVGVLSDAVAATEKSQAVIVQPTPIRPAVSATMPPTLRLGQIGERLGFALSSEFLRTLGFEHAARDKSAFLFHESDFAHICAALVNHINRIQAKQAA